MKCKSHGTGGLILFKTHTRYINPKFTTALQELASDGCKIYYNNESLVVLNDYDDISKQWKDGLKTGRFITVQVSIELPKWNHWLRKRQLCEKEKNKSSFEMKGNIPQAFKDALDKAKNKATDEIQTWDFKTDLGDAVKGTEDSQEIDGKIENGNT